MSIKNFIAKFFVFSVFMELACSPSPKYPAELPLSEVGKLEIPLDQFSSNFFLLSQLWISETGIEYLVHINTFPSNPNYLFFDDIREPSHSFRLELPVEGPQGVGSVSDFFVSGFDSIFVFDRYAYRMSLIDTSGRINRIYRLKNTEGSKPDADSALPWMTGKSRAFKRKNILYIPAVPDENPYHSGYEKKTLLIALNLDNGLLDYTMGYPSKYKKGGYWGGPDHNMPSIAETPDHDKVLVSYPADDSVYVFDLPKRELQPAFLAKSRILADILPGKFGDNGREAVLGYQLGTDYYFSLVYDPYRKRYYRFASQRYTDEDIAKMINREEGSPNRQSVMVFDSEFNHLTEYLIPSDLTPYMFYPLSSGTYFALMNMDDETKNELCKAIID